MSERHMREARALMEAVHEAVSDGCVDAWRACEARAAAALEAAEQRGVRAGLAMATTVAKGCEYAEQVEERLRRIDPASVDVKD